MRTDSLSVHTDVASWKVSGEVMKVVEYAYDVTREVLLECRLAIKSTASLQVIGETANQTHRLAFNVAIEASHRGATDRRCAGQV